MDFGVWSLDFGVWSLNLGFWIWVRWLVAVVVVVRKIPNLLVVFKLLRILSILKAVFETFSLHLVEGLEPITSGQTLEFGP